MVDPFQREIRKEFLLAGCFMAFNTINKWRRAVVEVTRRAAINNSPILPSNAKIYGGGMIYLPNILLPLAQEPSSSVLCLFPPHLSDILLNHATGGGGIRLRLYRCFLLRPFAQFVEHRQCLSSKNILFG